MSTLDLTLRYFRVSIKHEDIFKKAFITKNVCFSIKRTNLVCLWQHPRFRMPLIKYYYVWNCIVKVPSKPGSWSRSPLVQEWVQTLPEALLPYKKQAKQSTVASSYSSHEGMSFVQASVLGENADPLSQHTASYSAGISVIRWIYSFLTIKCILYNWQENKLVDCIPFCSLFWTFKRLHEISLLKEFKIIYENS